ncbi:MULTISPECIES: ABC transporter ATP-binding protein [unclassified Streptococcus]|uniref:ABC transporter ATP-binding protein n=1 Tax=unclassified Streptococcus TaxID=2608887 RepID=UPI0018AB5EF4|nr:MULTISPECIES: ABC transporter ATP-binding protein [unclassified Streptococcus]MBF8970795.1 ABC transporter ATP-binding protein [Streptococcus sp. NLN76]MBG9368167.1 ABC transporter ATP-binding protein [Streptococcus sp. NLN64]
MGPRDIIRWLYCQTKFLQGTVLFLSLISVLFSIVRIAFISKSRSVIDAAVGGDQSLLLTQMLVLALLAVLQLILRLLLPAMEDLLQTRLEVLFRKRVLEQIFVKPYIAVREMAVGEWLTRFFSDIEIVTSGLAVLIPNSLRIGVNILLSFYLLYQLVPGLTFWLGLAGIILFSLNLLFRKKFKEVHRAVQGSKDRLQVFLQEMMTNLVVVKAFRAESQGLLKFGTLQGDYERTRKKRRRLTSISSLAKQGSVQISSLLVICLGSFQIARGEISYGTLVALMQLVNNVMLPITNLSNLTNRYYALLASSERLMALEEVDVESQESSYPEEELEFQNLSFEAVDFSYSDKGKILSEVQLNIAAGDKIALTGTSGNGKSTLFYLMLGLYEPEEGVLKLRVKNRDYCYSDLSLAQIRSLFTYVPQGHALFSGTIRDNLLLGQGVRTDEEIWEALEKASATEFVRELPGQLDHLLGEQGKTLSEGQQQRLALARAFLSQAQILLLDEATSALDETTEKKVLASIAGLTEKTCIIVTHRPASLEVCDRQIQLEKGRVQERKS